MRTPSGYDPADTVSILRYARQLVGSTLRRELNEEQVRSWSGTGNKGRVGHAVEHYFGIPPNSDAGPDFADAGIELKVVPLKRGRSGLVAKERLYLSMIGYASVDPDAFVGSSTDLKSRRLLLVFYEWEKDQDVLEAPILDVVLWDRDEIVAELLPEAYRYVADRVARGQAHLISAGDTPVVGASTKGAARTWWQPPDGGEPARPRAFAIKEDYVQRLVRTLTSLGAEADTDRRFREALSRQLAPFIGLTAAELNSQLHLGVSMRSKQQVRQVAQGMMTWLRDGNHLERGFEELAEQGVTARAIRVDPIRLKPAEDVQLGIVPFDELVSMPFEGSRVAERTEELLFLLFEKRADLPSSRFLSATFWRPDDDERRMIREDYEAARAAIAASALDRIPAGHQVRVVRYGTKGEKGADSLPLPDGTRTTKRAFYITKRYLQSVLWKTMGGGATEAGRLC